MGSLISIHQLTTIQSHRNNFYQGRIHDDYGDVAGYSRPTGADGIGTNTALRMDLDQLTRAIESHGCGLEPFFESAVGGSMVRELYKTEDDLASIKDPADELS